MRCDLEELRREHDDWIIGAQLEQLLARIVRATAPSYPAAEYSDTSVWDSAALADALQDWVETRLLARGDLSKMLIRAPSIHALRGALTRSFEQFLINRRHRTSATNLYQRTTKILREDSAFVKLGSASRSHEQLWTLVDTRASERSRLGIPALVAIAFQLSDDDLNVVRYGSISLKSSPILRKPKLREFLMHLLGGADGALDQTTIAEVMRRRFGLFELQACALDGEADRVPAEVRPVERDVVVSSVLARVSPQCLAELRHFHSNGSQPRDPAELPCAVHEAITLVAQYAQSTQETEEIYDAVVESLF